MNALISAFALIASVQAAPQAGPTPEDVKINQLIIYGNDACPASTDDQINVCYKRPESDRLRIPENLRTEGDPASRSWGDRAVELSYVGRTGTGSCTPVGAGGATGCLNQLINAAIAERQTRDSVNWNRLIEEARQERLGRIDQEAAAVEAERSGAGTPPPLDAGAPVTP